MSDYETQLRSACGALMRGDYERFLAEYSVLRRAAATGEIIAAQGWDAHNVAIGRIAEIDKLSAIVTTIAKMQSEAADKKTS